MNAPQAPAEGRLFADRNFRWLFAGSLISQLGDQFTLIALPWLVLKMTGDTMALGTVLAMVSIPRALLLLVGGAVVDRHSPRRVLMLSKHACTLLLAALAALVLTGRADLALVHVLALAIGIATAFSLPSGSSILPTVMPPALLGQANGVMMGLRQLAAFAGPLLGGGLIAGFGGDALQTSTQGDYTGIGLAFAFDAASFALSAWTLARVKPLQAGAGSKASSSVLQSVGSGLRYCWRDASLRVCFCYWGAVALFITGPVQVAMPVLADHVGGSAAAYGVLGGAYGAGTLAGMALCGLRPGFRIGSFGQTMLLADAIVGLLFMPLGLIQSVWQGVALLLAIGTLGGFLQVNIFTWLQRHVAPSMLGRTMSLFMFIFMGVAPLSSAVIGWLMRAITLPQLFLASGGLLLLIVALTASLSGMRGVADQPASREGGLRA